MRSLPRRSTPALMVAALLLVPALAACGSDDDGDGDSGGDEAEALVVYVGRDEELVAPLMDQFTEETGIEVDVRYGDTPDMLATLLEEGDGTPADAFLSQDAGALGVLAGEGMLQELPEGITDAVADGYAAADGSWVGVTGRARVIAYNTDNVAEDEVPTTVAELTGKEWAGRVGLPPGNASFQAFVTGFRVAEGDEAAGAWLQDMADNDLQTFESNGDTLEAVDNGTVDIGLINHYYIFERIAEVGEDNVTVGLEFPEAGDPGALVNATGAAALSDHPDAEAFVEYLVSEAAQTYFTEETHEYPLIDGVPAPEGLPALADIEGPITDLGELADLEPSLVLIEEAGLS